MIRIECLFIQMILFVGMFFLVIPLLSLGMALITNYFKDRHEDSQTKASLNTKIAHSSSNQSFR